MDFLESVWNLLKADVKYIYSAVSGAFNVILGEVPDDEIAILHGAMDLAASKIKDGATVEETFTAVLNYVASSELKELSKVSEYLIQAFIQALSDKTS